MEAPSGSTRDDVVPQRQPAAGHHSGGDLLLQICAGQPDTAIHALRDIAKHTRDGMQIAYRKWTGSRPRNGRTGCPATTLGTWTGLRNPNVADPYVADRLLWVTDKTV